MAAILPVLTVASTILGVVGAIQQGRALSAAAKSQERLGRFQQALAERRAEVLEQQAGQERAISQREAFEERRRGRFVTSRIQSLSAASGAGALDPTIIGILGDVETEIDVRAKTALAEGEEAGRGLEFGAALERAGGQGELFASRVEANLLRAKSRRKFFSAGGTLLEGGTSFFEKFGDEPNFGFG